MSYFNQPRPRAPPQPGDILIVIHDFEARSSDELTLRKQDRVELIELDEGFGDGWYLGRHLGQKTTGLFPGVYTMKLPYNVITTSAPVSHAASPQVLVSPQPPHSAHILQPSPTSPQVASDPLPSEIAASISAANPPGQFGAPAPRIPVQPGPTSYIPSVQRSIGQALAGAANGEESPVMNETLSVIDEHITDLSTPRQSLAPPPRIPEDSESDYSRNFDSASYIAGPETESEDNAFPTEAEVRTWTAKQTATYLRSVGVDSKHCEIFEEQEISGDVLLDMDQSFIHMKEFDFGLMGRRLKTWHKIRDLQSQVKSSNRSGKPGLKQNEPLDDAARVHGRGLSGTTILPRIPSLAEEPGLSIRSTHHTYPHLNVSGTPAISDSPTSSTSLGRLHLGGGTPPSPWRASMAAESPSRPSAASIRDLNHSRRHSSMDHSKHAVLEPTVAPALLPTPHRKNPSLDRDWSLSNATTANTGTRTPSLRLQVGKLADSVGTPTDSNFDESSLLDLDRGYFSGNEVDNRKQRSYLRKKEGPASAVHSRQTSAAEEPVRPTVDTRRHSRLSSVDSSRDRSTQSLSMAAKAYYSSSKSHKGRFRSISALNPAHRSTSAQSPTVTNLEDEKENMLVISSPRMVSGSTSPATGVPLTSSQKARKLLGIRAASEAVTGSEKESAASGGTILTDSLKESSPASPSGSQTPSVNSKSIDIDSTETASRGTSEHLGPLLHTTAPIRTKPKTKKQTSAYTRGLLKLSPAEARKSCDYHGWMKKKSSGLMTPWKPRLFILRGKRLSYYYSEDDTEEKGIIDISGHKVLVDTDPMITFHATITGAASTPNPTSGASPPGPSPPVKRGSGDGAPFFFKLVPPKSGSSRAVQFTKPTVHHFQVDNIRQGRKWMGEIMKATIEHDLSSYETTNRQKTISLAKAKARKERPPALRETEDFTESPEEEKPKANATRESGLNIKGLDFETSELSLALSGETDGTKPSRGSEALLASP